MARAKALRVKAIAFNKQANKYIKAAELIRDNKDAVVDKQKLEKCGIKFLGNEILLIRLKLDKFIEANNNYLTTIAEKIRGEISVLLAFVNKAEKNLRALIQLKVAADLKLLRDIMKYSYFEL